MKVSLLVLLLGVLTSACGSDHDPSNPFAGSSTDSMNGTWEGSLPDRPIVGTGHMRVTLAHTGSRLSGTWSATFIQAAYNNGGTLSGSTTGTSVSVTLTPSIPTACQYAMTGTRQGNTLQGTFATIHCSAVSGGPITLIRH